MDKIDPLIRDLKDEAWGVREKAIEALARIGKPAVEPLIAALNDDVPAIRTGAAEALGKIKDSRAIEPLIQALKDETWGVREKAIEALAKIGKPAVAPLVEALEDEDVGVRTEAARALQEPRWRPKNHTHKASYLIAKKDWDELVRLGRPAVGPLIKVLKDKETRVREKAARALGEIGDVAAVGPLTESLEDTESIVRKAAEEALDRIKKTS